VISAATPENASQTEELLKTVNSMRFEVLLLIVAMAVLWGVYQLVSKWLERRREKDTEDSKAARAEVYSKAMNNLATAINQHTLEERTTSAEFIASLSGLTDLSDRVDQSLNLLVAKTNGQMNKRDSQRMIRNHLVRTAYREVCFIVERSLTENRFAERAAYVREKVKTAIGEIIAEARNELKTYPLSIAPEVFFKTYGDERSGSERFVLCDQLWDALEPMFKKQTPLRDRIEEAFLSVENVIKDYYSAIYNEAFGFATKSAVMEVGSESAAMCARSTRLLDEEREKKERTRSGRLIPVRRTIKPPDEP
jgi:hypothetical protein